MLFTMLIEIYYTKILIILYEYISSPHVMCTTRRRNLQFEVNP